MCCPGVDASCAATVLTPSWLPLPAQSAAVVWSKKLHDCPYFNPNRSTRGGAPVSTQLRTVQAVAVSAAPASATGAVVTATVVMAQPHQPATSTSNPIAVMAVATPV